MLCLKKKVMPTFSYFDSDPSNENCATIFKNKWHVNLLLKFDIMLSAIIIEYYKKCLDETIKEILLCI